MVDPQREYVAFTSRFFLDSVRRAPVFMWRSFGIMKQAKTALRLVGWSLASDLFRLELYRRSRRDSEPLPPCAPP